MRVQHFQLLPLLAFQKLSNHTSKPFQPCRRICPTMLALVIGGTFDSAMGGVHLKCRNQVKIPICRQSAYLQVFSRQ